MNGCHQIFHPDRQPRAMQGGVDEQVHVIQDEGAIDVDVDAASVALELPGIEGRRSSACGSCSSGDREVLRFDRDALIGEVGRASDDRPSVDQGRCAGRSYPGRSVPPAVLRRRTVRLTMSVRAGCDRHLNLDVGIARIQPKQGGPQERSQRHAGRR